ncbi:MAG: endonuclease/exonuclease/phosphatase family protein, partial [Rhodospirillaceae bacterium]|nr:endonuclease/exonuclease/phosphatase family protein [Rhodospirillaceae bacterium]
MKIATWNVNSLRVRLRHVIEWLQRVEPDVLGLQETKLTDEHFPVAAFEDLGYRSVFSGQPTYNGVALLSREPAADVATELERFPDPEKRVLAASFG